MEFSLVDQRHLEFSRKFLSSSFLIWKDILINRRKNQSKLTEKEYEDESKTDIRKDFMDRMIYSQTEEGDKLTDKEIMDEIMLFFVFFSQNFLGKCLEFPRKNSNVWKKL